jgi:uncharacterized iron-regulated membrane protein
MAAIPSEAPRKTWPDYAAVWRWHFYAGLLCIPFVLWLAITGSIYLFKPQVEAWIDAPYDRLEIVGYPAAPSLQADAARAALPGAHLNAYELPLSPQSATRILVGSGDDVFRVYINPYTLDVLKIVNEGDRFMHQISFLHGELAMGDRGSLIVELAACWAIIMLLTGMFLWWPRSISGAGGVIVPRLNAGPRLFWRDLHAVTGIWVCGAALFLLLTGLPWAKNWGGYLKDVREITGTLEGPQDWSTGRSSELAQRRASAPVEEDHSEHNHGGATPISSDAAPLDQLVPLARALNLAPPVLITPPRAPGGVWIAKSDAQNRTLRNTYELDPAASVTIGQRPFAARHPIDQAIGIGISAHEGALFGWPNLLLSLSAALGLILLCVSAVVLWLRRRPREALGAPEPRARPRFSALLLVSIAVLAVLFPMFGASLALVWLSERLVLRHVAPVRDWLGLAA